MSRKTRKRILLIVLGLFAAIIIYLILLRKYSPDRFDEQAKKLPIIKSFYITVLSYYCDFFENQYFVYSTDKCGGKVDCSKEEKWIDPSSKIPFQKVQINKSECGPPTDEMREKKCKEMGYYWNNVNFVSEIFHCNLYSVKRCV